MKLFKSLLVAPATLGLLAPMSVSANELNITEVTGYSSSEEVQNISEFNTKELAVTNSRVDGLEARMNNIEAGSFSETTTAAFSADMYLGSVTGGAAPAEAVNATYSFQIDLNTSFTGEDSLDVSIDAGNSGAAGTVEFDGNGSGDTLVVDGVSYTFPLGDSVTAFVGDSTDGSLLFTTACVYGGPSNTLDDCGNGFSALNGGGGTAFGASYDFGNGFTSAFGVTTEGSTADGVLTAEGDDAYAINAAYTADNYGVSLTFADKEAPAAGITESTFWGLNAYYTPSSDGMPSISAGYESAESDVVTVVDDVDSSHWFVGLSWDEVGPGTAGLAVGTKQHTLDIDGEAFEEMLMYEAYYSYDINDGMSVTPLVFIKDNAVDGVDDETGVMVKTSFAF